MSAEQKIIHIDMDAFYASVEQRDEPALRGKPVVVGGPPNSRSVVCTASYEARVFGVRSAMPCSQAQRLCPHALFVYPRFEVYQQVSAQLRRIFLDYTDLVEPLSLDEAYLDVTQNKVGNPSATRIAQEIRQRIWDETGLTASAGVAPNKFLAKLASDFHKPNGLTVIRPEQVEAFLLPLPVKKIHGIGEATNTRMAELGIHTVADLRRWHERELVLHFGKTGHWYYQLARGQDPRSVKPNRPRKSIGAEETFARDVLDIEALEQKLWELSHEVAEYAERRHFEMRTITLKVTYTGFEKITRSKTVEHPLSGADALWRIARSLLREHTHAGQKAVRLIGVSVSNPLLDRAESPQLLLPFPTPAEPSPR
ncbi:MAG: DNA polymerase IV [Myxococcota bacterium]